MKLITYLTVLPGLLMLAMAAYLHSGSSADKYGYSFFIYTFIWLVVVLSQYGKMGAFDGIYRKWKKIKNTQDGVALEGLTYKDMFRFRKFEQIRKKKIQNGEVSNGFTIEQFGSLGCIFYSDDKTHTVASVAILNDHHLITIPLIFSTLVGRFADNVDAPRIKKMFYDWARDNGYEIEHLLVMPSRGYRLYDPEQE